MRMALQLAKKGKGKTSPNPLVGCVIVNDGRVVGKGYHEYFGGPHAEINALKQAGMTSIGSTLYVTLQPCNHIGKTPPCTDAIIKAGVKRVVVATLDPNELAGGTGLRKLRRNSIVVSRGLLKREAQSLNAEYLLSQKNTKPAVIVKAAMSIDGKIATRTGDSKWITSRQSRSYVHTMRSKVDAILVGWKTIVRDNPQLTSHGIGRDPVRVILDPQLRVPVGSSVFDGTVPTIVFCGPRQDGGKLKILWKKRIITVPLPIHRGQMNFGDIIRTLKQFSLRSVLIEGGGETIASAIEAGVVTNLTMFISPRIIGGRSAITPVEGLGVSMVRRSRILREPQLSRIGSDFLFTAKF